ncbi:MAG: hypothetical protein ABIM89_18220 [Mycobacteriales bacterium]
MFLFFGITPKTKRYGFVSSYCDVHGGPAQHELSSYRSWFKLFFVLSLFPVGRERHLLTCSQCGAMYDVAPEEARRLATQAEDIDVTMAGGGFGGGLLRQMFGGSGFGGHDNPERRDRSVPPEPYPSAEDEFRTTPYASPDEPMRVRSKRMDDGG